jgi:hypothetical protein
MTGFNIQIEPEALTPLIRAVVQETISAVEADRARVSAKLAYTEAEAASLLSLRTHQLRDERRRGRIKASHGPGKMILYSQANLLEYLASRPYTPNPDDAMAALEGRLEVLAESNGNHRTKRREARD